LAAGPGDVAGFAAVGTIIQPVDSEAHSFEALADGAVFIAGAVFLGFVALRAENLLAGGHRCLRKKLYLRGRRSARGGWWCRYIRAKGGLWRPNRGSISGYAFCRDLTVKSL
jgi:hypothetical protein